MLVMSIGLFAQDWVPINTTERFCYSSDDTLDMINNVLWVEEFEQVDDAQVYHLNKIAIPFENGEGSLFLYNQPQFLLDDVWVFPDGDWVFQDTFFLPIEELESYTLKPHAVLNESWDFATNMTATISEIGLMDLFGAEDSIKTISVSNGLNIILSKNHGIINWNNEYQLIGIEGRDLGFQVPNFEDMYAEISAGDVICFSSLGYMADSQVSSWYRDIRYDIETVTWYQDSLQIYAFVSSLYATGGKSTNVIVNQEYMNIVLYRDRFTDAYPNEVLFFHDYQISPNQGYLISKLSHYKWGGLMKSQVTFESEFPEQASLLFTCEGLFSYELCDTDYGSEYLVVENSVNYGFTEYANSGFEWGGHGEIVGLINDGDTTGSIYSLDLFVGQQEMISDNSFAIYPSPAKETIKIQTQETGEIQFQIFNISGQLVQEGKEEKQMGDLVLNIDKLQHGIYILQLTLNDQIIRKKFIKQM